MRDPHIVIVKPHITEKTVGLSYGNSNQTENQLARKYTFLVAPDSNKVEIKYAIEAIYNQGKKVDDRIQVTSVRTVKIHGKTRKSGWRVTGKRPDLKKAVITLAPGQMLEDYGV